MTTALLAVAAPPAALACPLHMLWMARRAASARCGMPGPCGGESLRARQERLAARVESVRDQRPSRLG